MRSNRNADARRSVALTGSGTRASKPRRAIQIALGALSWIGFALLWLWQLEVYIPATWLYSICLIGSILGVWILFTICWVRWNRNIYARRHRRNSPVRQEVAFYQDTLGRPILAPGGIRAAEGQVIVSVDGAGNKRYDRARRAPRLPRIPDGLPDWSAPLPAALRERTAAAAALGGNGNGDNGNGHHPAPVNGDGNGNPAPVNENETGNGHRTQRERERERAPPGRGPRAGQAG